MNTVRVYLTDCILEDRFRISGGPCRKSLVASSLSEFHKPIFLRNGNPPFSVIAHYITVISDFWLWVSVSHVCTTTTFFWIES